jgi:hypothetical protein
MATLWAFFPQAIFIPKQHSVHAFVKFHFRTLHSVVGALVDSGATESFISSDLVKHFSVPTYPIPEPRNIRNVDGSLNKIGQVTHAADLQIKYQNQTSVHTFYVIKLGNDYMLLGMPFLAATNPQINWTHGHFVGKVLAAIKDAHKWRPNQDSKVYKPFVNQLPEGYRHYEHDSESPHMLNITPEDYEFV